jgi:uncharacterized damage-inducible protein DinB
MQPAPPPTTALSRGRCPSLLELAPRYLEEYLEKIGRSVERLEEEQVWWRPLAGTNSIGNLLLHLRGNLSLWILEGIGGRPFERDRHGELNADRTHQRDELLRLLTDVVTDCREVLSGLEPGDLERPLDIQGYETDTLGALFHAVEHMSYHTGQIVFIVKQLTFSEGSFEFYPQHRDE